MKAIVILIDGSLGQEPYETNAMSNMISALLRSPGVTINNETIKTAILYDEDVAKCLVQHIVTPAKKPSKTEVETAKEVQLQAFCKDVLGTCGEQPLADQAAYRRKFITWMLNDTKAYSSEIVQSLTNPTKRQMEILREHGLQNIPTYLKIIQQI